MKVALSFFCGIILSVLFQQFTTNFLSVAIAQDVRPEAVAEQVYQTIPDFPRENQYLSQETGEISPNNTLISRLIRYHQNVKSRPVKYRLDWQLTIADYLQVNETIAESRYPGKDTLSTHPLEGDKKAIASLSRRQRNQLIDLLVTIYNPGQATPNNTTETIKPPVDSGTNNNSLPPLPQPGDAELLR